MYFFCVFEFHPHAEDAEGAGPLDNPLRSKMPAGALELTPFYPCHRCVPSQPLPSVPSGRDS